MVKIKISGNVVERFETSNTKFAVVEVKRKSGTGDRIFVLDNAEQLVVGRRVEVKGDLITRKFTRESRKMWYVVPNIIDGIVDIQGGWHNQVEAEVRISDNIKLRETPAGKKIAELTFNDEENHCYLYAIAFNEYAEELFATIKKGDKVKVTKARLQSRWYGPETNQSMVNELLINELSKI